ncbi:MAG: hypothetical protein J5841_07935 [Clostridia bacterium]|nr:hypothetical protein [Clostridia bacterium]
MKQVKYMHFISSCSFTALAYILAEKGIETEDTEIVRAAGLPWIFAREGKRFLTGPMLQGKKWFDLYLNPRGLCMCEEQVERERLAEYLQTHELCMIGLRLQGHSGKHAVVMERKENKYFVFFNPIREGSGQAAEIRLTEEELIRAADPVMVAGSVTQFDGMPGKKTRTEESLSVLEDNYREIEQFCRETHAREEYDKAMDDLFRALLLDGITMLELTEETELAEAFRKEQRGLLAFMKGKRTGLLAEYISLERLKAAVEEYGRVIQKQR